MRRPKPGDRVFQCTNQPRTQHGTKDGADHDPDAIGFVNHITTFFTQVQKITKADKDPNRFQHRMQGNLQRTNVNSKGKLQE